MYVTCVVLVWLARQTEDHSTPIQPHLYPYTSVKWDRSHKKWAMHRLCEYELWLWSQCYEGAATTLTISKMLWLKINDSWPAVDGTSLYTMCISVILAPLNIFRSKLFKGNYKLAIYWLQERELFISWENKQYITKIRHLLGAILQFALLRSTGRKCIPH